MSATLGTLQSLAVYILLVVLGGAVGSRPTVRKRELAWVGRVQFFALMALIFSLGVQLGANEEIISSLGSIGLTAFVLTVLAMGGSLLTSTLLRRFVLRLDAFGRPVHTQGVGADTSERESVKADTTLTKWIVLAVAAGMLAGRFFLPGRGVSACGRVIDLGLYLLLFLVGLDMGRQGSILSDIRAAGWRVLLFPLSVALGTLLAAMAGGVFLPIGIKDAAAAAAGFGWYSLAPTLLAPYSLSVSAVAFLSNVMREIFSILLIPLVAKHVGYVECAALPGAAAMDTVLPVVVGATHERVAVYSFTSGVALSLLVPVLVPAIAALPF